MVVIVAAFAAGLLLQVTAPRAVAASKLLDRVVLGVAVPALVLLRVPELPVSLRAVVPLAVAWGALALAVAVVLIAGRLGRWSRRTVGTLLLVTPLGNTAFLGLAAIGALVGTSAVPPAIAYDQLGTFLGLVIYGSVVTSRYGVAGDVPVSVVRRLLAFPPFLALLVSIPLRFVAVPGAIEVVLGALAALVAPLALLSLGLRFRLRIDRDHLGPAAVCLATKMVLMPAAALVALAAAGGGPVWAASTMQAGMPPMVTAGVVATTAGLDERLSTFVVGAGLLAAFVTLPVISFLVT